MFDVGIAVCRPTQDTLFIVIHSFVFVVIHSVINLLRDSGTGSGGARAPHILLRMLRALRSGLPRPKAARYDFCRHV